MYPLSLGRRSSGVKTWCQCSSFVRSTEMDDKSRHHSAGLFNYLHFSHTNQLKRPFIYTINRSPCKCCCRFVCPLLSRHPGLKQMSLVSKSTVCFSYLWLHGQARLDSGLCALCSQDKAPLWRRSRLYGNCCAFLGTLIDNLSVRSTQSSTTWFQSCFLRENKK